MANTRFKNMYEKAKENFISPSMIYIYDQVSYAFDNENVKLTDDEMEEVCEFIDSCTSHSDHITIYGMARHFATLMQQNNMTIKDVKNLEVYTFLTNAIAWLND